MSKKVGAPKKEIDLEQLANLAAMMCTQREAAAFFKMTKQTFIERMKEPHYLEAWENGQCMGKISLRRAQYKAAMKGNISMLIWLGKQQLEQFDNPKPSNEGGGLILRFVDTAKTGTVLLKPRDETENAIGI